jgi:hypothetical protein
MHSSTCAEGFDWTSNFGGNLRRCAVGDVRDFGGGCSRRRHYGNTAGAAAAPHTTSHLNAFGQAVAALQSAWLLWYLVIR